MANLAERRYHAEGIHVEMALAQSSLRTVQELCENIMMHSSRTDEQLGSYASSIAQSIERNIGSMMMSMLSDAQERVGNWIEELGS